MSDLNEALMEYDNKNYEKAYYLFREYRKKVEDKEEFDRYHSYKFFKTIFETKLKRLEKLDNDTQEDIVYIIKHTKPSDFYYKLVVFNTIELLEKNRNVNWKNILTWLKKLNPDYLEKTRNSFESKGKQIVTFSELEKYYLKITKAYEKLEDYNNLYLLCNDALNKITTFTNNSDIWIKRRLAMCYKNNLKYQEALSLYKDILMIKKDWYIYREIGSLYEKLNDKNNASLNYFEAFTKLFDLSKTYTFIHYFATFIENKELKRKVYLLLLAFKEDKKIELTKEDKENKEKLNISDKEISEINIEQYFKKLKKEVNDLKLNYQDRKTGIVINKSEKFCFIESDKNRYFCNIKEFPKNMIPEINMKVEFTLTESFDKKKNQNSYVATNIRIVK